MVTCLALFLQVGDCNATWRYFYYFNNHSCSHFDLTFPYLRWLLTYSTYWTLLPSFPFHSIKCWQKPLYSVLIVHRAKASVMHSRVLEQAEFDRVENGFSHSEVLKQKWRGDRVNLHNVHPSFSSTTKTTSTLSSMTPECISTSYFLLLFSHQGTSTKLVVVPPPPKTSFSWGHFRRLETDRLSVKIEWRRVNLVLLLSKCEKSSIVLVLYFPSIFWFLCDKCVFNRSNGTSHPGTIEERETNSSRTHNNADSRWGIDEDRGWWWGAISWSGQFHDLWTSNPDFFLQINSTDHPKEADYKVDLLFYKICYVRISKDSCKLCKLKK